MWQNSRFMIKLAWTSKEKKVINLSLFSAALAVALNLVNLYVSPTILSAVERHVSAGELFWTIAGFALALMLVSAASAYVNTNTLFGRISVRAEITGLLNPASASPLLRNNIAYSERKIFTWIAEGAILVPTNSSENC